jgi:Domain of unknown function (DUF4404)
MSPSAESLRDTLFRLHEQLRDTHNVDDETRQLLVGVIEDIRAVVGGVQSVDGGQSADGNHGSLIARLHDAERSFEVTHATLAGVIRGLIDVLGQMGI